jgi:hypothetical protein
MGNKLFEVGLKGEDKFLPSYFYQSANLSVSNTFICSFTA